MGRWKTGAVVLACVLFSTAALLDSFANRELTIHLDDMKTSGGGVLLVMTPADCLATSEAVRAIGSLLTSAGVAVRGLVISDGVSTSDIQMVLGEANRRFIHVPVRGRTVHPFAGLMETPIALGVTANGHLVFVEQVSSVVATAGLRSVAERFRKKVAGS